MKPIELWFSVLFSDDVEGNKLDLNPNDPGNYTPEGKLLGSQCGISAKVYPNAPFGNITPSYAAGIAKASYWDAHNLDEFPAAIAILLADTYYNGGSPIRWLQESIGAYIDGDWGSESKATLVKVWAKNSLLAMQTYNACRIAYDSSLKDASADIKGWAKRCNIMLCIAIQANGGLASVSLT